MTGGQGIVVPHPRRSWKDPLQVTWLQWPWEGGLSG